MRVGRGAREAGIVAKKLPETRRSSGRGSPGRASAGEDGHRRVPARW